jgi:hypothetical protein
MTTHRARGGGMRRVIIGLFLSLITLAFPGCDEQNASLDTPQAVLDSTLLAMSKLKTYTLNVNLSKVSKNPEQPDSVVYTHTWQSESLVDASLRKMKQNMNIDDSIFQSSPDFFFDRYFSDGWSYLDGRMFHGKYPWKKNELTQALWDARTGLPGLLTLLRSATDTRMLDNEFVGGKECYVLETSPAAATIVEWILSQKQEYGPSIYSGNWAADAESSRETYLSSIKNSSLKVWVAVNDTLIVKAEIHAGFDITYISDRWVLSGETPQKARALVDFAADVGFSNYNRRVSIKVPADALKAEKDS